jgi:hypothetical protein
MKRLAFIAFLLSAATAQAQQWVHLPMICGPHVWLSGVVGKEGQKLLHAGEVRGDRVVQFWVNQSTGTWTEVMLDGDTSCIMAEGSKFDPTPAAYKPGEPS